MLEQRSPIYQKRFLIASILLVLVVTLTPGDGKIAGNYLDKVAHFMIFLILSISCCYTYQQQEKHTEAMLWVIVLGLLTEVVQQFIPGRNMDIYDGIADTLGVVAGYYVYRIKPLK